MSCCCKQESYGSLIGEGKIVYLAIMGKAGGRAKANNGLYEQYYRTCERFLDRLQIIASVN